MDRKEFLRRCQLFAVMGEVARDIMVVHDGIEYFPKACKVWFNEKGETINTAVLLDVGGNCLVDCDLREVECL